MGDRANTVVLDTFTDEAVFLYGHWSGSDLPETVRKALDSTAGRSRWKDSAYLARIVFDAMSAGEQGAETGFGIATRPPDNEYDFIVLSCKDQLVYRLARNSYEPGQLGQELGLKDSPSISFSDYAAVAERTWENLTEEVGADA
jgi:hypothetical protein